MPFSIVAVVILVGSVATGAYMQQVSRTESERRVSSAGEGAELVMPGLRAGLEAIAARCIDSAVDRQTDPGMDEGSQGLWSVDLNFRELFEAGLRSEWGRKEMGRYCLTVEAGESTLQLSTFPMTIRAINKLGMAVNMTAPGGFRISGFANFTFTGQGQKVQKKVDFGLDRPSWYPLALFQANRLRRDCANEGLMELIFRQMFAGYLDADFAEVLEARNRTRRSDPASTATVGDWWKNRPFEGPGFNAVDAAMMMEEQALFGGSRYDWFGGMLGALGERPVALYNALDHPAGMFRGAEAFNDSGDGGLDIPFGPFVHGMTVVPVNGSGRGAAHFDFSVGSEWGERPQPFYRKVAFAGEEVEVDVYVLEVYVNGVYRLRAGPDADHLMTLDIPVHLQFQMDRRFWENNSALAESGRHHCEIEDLGLFDKEYARLYSDRQNLTIQVVNSSGVRASSLPDASMIDISLDGDTIGTFRNRDFRGNGVVLENVPSGPHGLAVVISDLRDRTAEYAAVSLSLEGGDGAISAETVREADTSQLWTYILTYLRDAPPEARLVRTLELFSRLTGYPMPADVRGASGASAEGTQRLVAWAVSFADWLVRAGALATSAGGMSSQSLKGIAEMLNLVIIAITQVERVLGLGPYKAADRGSKLISLGFRLVKGPDSADKFRCLEAEIKSDGASASIKNVKPEGAKEWSASAGDPKTSGPDGSAKTDGSAGARTAQFKCALDFAAVLFMIATYYMKGTAYASDGSFSEPERIDLQIDFIKIVLKTASFLAKLVSVGLGEASKTAAKAACLIGEGVNLLVAIICLYQSVKSESDKFRGDPVFWATLTDGLDEATVTFYYTLMTAVISVLYLACMAAVGLGLLVTAAPILAVLGPIGWIALLVYCIVLLVLNWDAISNLVEGTVASNVKQDAVRSMTHTLRQTASTVASLNEFRSDGLMASARESRGNGYALGNLASFSNDATLSFQFWNLSAQSYDMGGAKESQARAARSLRYFIIGLWMQADDFIDPDSRKEQALYETGDRHCFADDNWYGRDFDWDGDIVVGGDAELDQKYIPARLMGLDRENVGGFEVSYRLTENGWVPESAMKDWMATIARIGDQVALWQERLVTSQSLARYVSELDGLTYRNDLGYLLIQLAPEYSSARVRVVPEAGGPVSLLEGEGMRTVGNLEIELTCSTVPQALYLAPGKYKVETISISPDLKPSKTSITVEAVPIHSLKFSPKAALIAPKACPIYFTIDDRFNGTANVSVECYDFDGNLRGVLFRSRNFTCLENSGGEFNIDEQWIPGFDFDHLGGPVAVLAPAMEDNPFDAVKMTIKITIALDRGSDGTIDSWANLSIATKAIRDDHVMRMKADGKKTDRQLHYRLEIYNETRKIGEGVINGGEQVEYWGYSDWVLI